MDDQQRAIVLITATWRKQIFAMFELHSARRGEPDRSAIVVLRNNYWIHEP